MNPEQIRARLKEIAAELEKFQALEDPTEEQVNSIDALNVEFESLNKKLTVAEKAAANLAASQSSTRQSAPAPVNTPTVEVRASRLERNGGFASFGEFAKAVKESAMGKRDPRFNNTMFEKIGEDGGFLVPEEMGEAINKKLQSDESLLARATQFRVNGNSLSLPIDETAPWSGGIQAYWTGEGEAITESKHKFGRANMRLHKLAALVKLTDELVEDTAALESYILSQAPGAIMHKVNEAILTGDGVGKPTGLLNSGFKVQVAKESGQTADTVVARNVIKMWSAMIPQARAGAVWLINPAVEPQLLTMKDDNDNFIYLAPGSQMNQSPYALLLGRPVIPMIGATKALGDEGDITFVNLAYYYTILKAGGMKQSVSTHLYFDKDITAYKFTMRIDGQCPFKAPITTQNGGYTMSGVVTLADRA